MRNKVTYISYSKEHMQIVSEGIDSINKVLNGKEMASIKSLLFCLDRYMDPYYGYKLSFYDELVCLLQRQLFMDFPIDVKEDILDLLIYNNDNLDYLAERIDIIECRLLAQSIATISCTYNKKYISIYEKYKNHEDKYVREEAMEAIAELIKLKN